MTGKGDWTALVLAGTRPTGDPLARACGVTHKALIRVAGEPMLLRVVRTLLASRGAGEILLCGLDAGALSGGKEIEGVLRTGRLRLVTAAGTPSTSVQAVLERGDAVPPLLVTTADHPLLTPATVEEFWRGARASGADVAVGMVDAGRVRAAFPTGQRTVLKLRGESFCGCNLFAFLTPESRRVPEAWVRIEQYRKQPWKMVRVLGVLTVLRFLLGRLSLDDVFALASTRMGARVRPVLLSDGAAGFDVDKPSDLEIADAFLGPREARGCG